MRYSELQCSEAIHKAVERMGFEEMTEIQEKVIPLMMEGRDVIAKAPTGTGKTCAFGIPVAEHIRPEEGVPQAVILAPTRELAQQIAGDMEDLTYFMPAVKVACVYGGANMDKQARRLAEGCQIVVATPGRLMDHYKHRSIDLSHVTQIVLDEADEMLNMGFYKDVRHIIDLMRNRKSLSMFSATISREVMDIGWLYQRDAEEVTVQPKEESQPKITQYKLETSGRNKLSDLAQLIIGEGYKRVMVFCDTKFATATLANQLARLGFSVDCLHGDLSQKDRNRIMQSFRDGKVSVLVATDVAARGIHRPRQKGRRQLPVLYARREKAGGRAAAHDPQHRPVPAGALRFQPRTHRGGEKEGHRGQVPDPELLLIKGTGIRQRFFRSADAPRDLFVRCEESARRKVEDGHPSSDLRDFMRNMGRGAKAPGLCFWAL